MPQALLILRFSGHYHYPPFTDAPLPLQNHIRFIIRLRITPPGAHKKASPSGVLGWYKNNKHTKMLRRGPQEDLNRSFPRQDTGCLVWSHGRPKDCGDFDEFMNANDLNKARVLAEIRENYTRSEKVVDDVSPARWAIMEEEEMKRSMFSSIPYPDSVSLFDTKLAY